MHVKHKEFARRFFIINHRIHVTSYVGPRNQERNKNPTLNSCPVTSGRGHTSSDGAINFRGCFCSTSQRNSSGARADADEGNLSVEDLTNGQVHAFAWRRCRRADLDQRGGVGGDFLTLTLDGVTMTDKVKAMW